MHFRSWSWISLLQELHDDCPLAQNKREIKSKTLSVYQLKTTDDYNIFIDNVKKLAPSFDQKLTP